MVTCWVVLYAAAIPTMTACAEPLSVATFQADVTPPLGSPLFFGIVPKAKRVVDPLTARGVVLLVKPKPIVLCAVDWIGIANDSYDTWRSALAEAAGTTPDHVALQVVHQHEAPGSDVQVEALLAARGLSGRMYDPAFDHEALARAARAIRACLREPQTVTTLGIGMAKVDKVASSRRLLAPDGTLKCERLSWCEDPEIRAAEEGLIDPYVRLVSFWDNDRPVASLMYYACHPQSFYRRGAINADFVGLARGLRQSTIPDALHVYFTGAAGNVATGKYNDGGSPPRRFDFAARLADGMTRAWEAQEKYPIASADVQWKVRTVRVPLREGWTETSFLKELDDEGLDVPLRIRAARNLVWVRRCEEEGAVIDLTCLHVGEAKILHLPGEPFVEYQLAAQKMSPEAFVCVAGYGDYGPGYIGTAVAYEQGGYETGPVSRVAPGVESILMSAMRELLR
ncbi:MAG: hypothetical protein JXA69_15910 [Phycisphaerae bacterium]|nr:hypothetical protein [Phycisphaerae bacterium]